MHGILVPMRVSHRVFQSCNPNKLFFLLFPQSNTFFALSCSQTYMMLILQKSIINCIWQNQHNFENYRKFWQLMLQRWPFLIPSFCQINQPSEKSIDTRLLELLVQKWMNQFCPTGRVLKRSLIDKGGPCFPQQDYPHQDTSAPFRNSPWFCYFLFLSPCAKVSRS